MTVTKTNANIHRGRFVIRFYSQKNQCVLNPESFQELVQAFKLECDPNVEMFATQPEQIEVTIDKKVRRYTPDFLVLYRSGFAEYIEIHHESQVDNSYRSKIHLFNEYTRKTAQIGIRLIIVDKLNTIFMANLNLITMYYSKPSFPLTILSTRELTFGELIESLEGIASCPVSEAYGLIASNVYNFDMQKPLTVSTILTRVYFG
ncbi:TnsA endonuclease N-terminal domain-containing protein [Pseudoalteromonas issachenkonii]|uniref:TnsA endonuclease N-terminal domain-containing protein n=1 Tax=Pseudoalteromonas issachenkonii TaxID=152297 RepID=A0ABU9GVK1_9GAMM